MKQGLDPLKDSILKPTAIGPVCLGLRVYGFGALEVFELWLLEGVGFGVWRVKDFDGAGRGT